MGSPVIRDEATDISSSADNMDTTERDRSKGLAAAAAADEDNDVDVKGTTTPRSCFEELRTEEISPGCMTAETSWYENDDD